MKHQIRPKEIKLPLKYSKEELKVLVKDKEFIKVYKDFNLQYLKEVVIPGHE